MYSCLGREVGIALHVQLRGEEGIGLRVQLAGIALHVQLLGEGGRHRPPRIMRHVVNVHNEAISPLL